MAVSSGVCFLHGRAWLQYVVLRADLTDARLALYGIAECRTVARLVNEGLEDVLALAECTTIVTSHPLDCFSMHKTFWVQLYLFCCQLFRRLVQCLCHLSKVVCALQLRIAHKRCLCLS